MTLLTPEQQARLDAAVAEAALSRSPQTSSFLAGQSPEKAHRGVCKVGKPHSKHRKQPGTGTHWGSVFDSTREPVFSIDERDPNYDEDDVAAVSAGTSTSFAARSRESPRVDSVALYKHSVETFLLELFSTGDVGAARVELQELEQPLYGHYAVKKAVRKQSPTRCAVVSQIGPDFGERPRCLQVTMSLDHGAKEKELCAQLLSAACPQELPREQLVKGFTRLLESAQDLALDVPDAPAQLALFIARAVTDDVLPPAFVASAMVRPCCISHFACCTNTVRSSQEHLPENASAARAALTAAKAHLAAPVAGERLSHAWGDRAASTLADAKAAVDRILGEYFTTRDVGETGQSLRDLHVPFFAHQLVKRALQSAVEHSDREAATVALLSHLAETGAVSTQQMGLGFSRAAEGLDDLTLDVPDAQQRWARLLNAARAAGALGKVSAFAAAAAGGIHDETLVSSFKAQCSDIVAEYLASGAVDDACARLSELLTSPAAAAVVASSAGQSVGSANGYDDDIALAPGAVFVKRLITHAADRGPRCRELAAVLLSRLVPRPLTRAHVEAGFMLLLRSTEDFTLDVPDAPELLLLYILRAIVDDVASPAWLRHAKISLAGTAGGEVARAATAALSARHVAERALRAWIGPYGVSAAGVKGAMRALCAEYLTTLDVDEATRCLRELEVPFYTHEAVKTACVTAAEAGDSAIAPMSRLIDHWAETGAASTQQMALGLRRAAEAMDDLELDAPGAANRWKEMTAQLASAGVHVRGA